MQIELSASGFDPQPKVSPLNLLAEDIFLSYLKSVVSVFAKAAAFCLKTKNLPYKDRDDEPLKNISSLYRAAHWYYPKPKFKFCIKRVDSSEIEISYFI